MAYLTFTASDENQNSCFKFIGSNNGVSNSVSLITGESIGSVSLISPSVSSEGGLDTCSFYSGPSDSTIMAFGESFETAGSVAYFGGESTGSIAYSGAGESCGSVASASVGSSCGSSSGGSCDISC